MLLLFIVFASPHVLSGSLYVGNVSVLCVCSFFTVHVSWPARCWLVGWSTGAYATLVLLVTVSGLQSGGGER